MSENEQTGSGPPASDVDAIAQLAADMGTSGAVEAGIESTDAQGDGYEASGVESGDDAAEVSDVSAQDSTTIPESLTRAELDRILLHTLQARGVAQAVAPQSKAVESAIASGAAAGNKQEFEAKQKKIEERLAQLDEDDPVRAILQEQHAENKALRAAVERSEAFMKQLQEERAKQQQEAEQREIAANWSRVADELRGKGFEHALGRKGAPLSASAKYHITAYAQAVDALMYRYPGLTENKARELALSALPAKPKSAAAPASVRRPAASTRSAGGGGDLPSNATDDDRIALLGKLMSMS